jgi:very-short-patch-repair endonuclease
MALSGDNRQLIRVQQAALALQLEGNVRPQEVFLDQGAVQLLDEAARTFKAQSGVLQAKVHSSYQRSIASVLAKQRVMHVLEDNTTGYSVDVSIPSLRVAVEADGPSHMSRNTVTGRGRVQLGATAMKRRHLQGLGWAVANISYEDWDELANEEQRASFLKLKIKWALAELAAEALT